MLSRKPPVGCQSIDAVIERMDDIAASLPPDDGVALFNRMYRHVTACVRDSEVRRAFRSVEFLDRLDCVFADLYFEAYDADRVGGDVAEPWRPLFEHRLKPRTHPIQFAIAGMNAHISHDLCLAVVGTCRELGIGPDEGSDVHRDFRAVNLLLEEAMPEIKGWFATGVLGVVDDGAGKVDDAFAMFSIRVARDVAWESAEVLWGLQDSEHLEALFRESLSRSVAFANRGILL